MYPVRNTQTGHLATDSVRSAAADRRRPGRLSIGLSAFVLALVVSGLTPATSKAGFSVDVNVSYGADNPASTGPWLTALFQDTGSGTVRLTLSANLVGSQEYISEVWFNFEAVGIAANTLQVQKLSDSPAGEVAAPTLTLADNNDGNPLRDFDLKLLFQQAQDPVPGRFQGTEVIVLELSSTAGAITSDYFKFTNEDYVGNPAFKYAYVGAKIQGIGFNGEGSGRIGGGDFDDRDNLEPTPVPPSLLLALMGLASFGGVGLVRRLRSTKATV